MSILGQKDEPSSRFTCATSLERGQHSSGLCSCDHAGSRGDPTLPDQEKRALPEATRCLLPCFPPLGRGAEAAPSPLTAGSQCLSPMPAPGLAAVPLRPGELVSVAMPGHLVCLENLAAAVLRPPLPCFQAGRAKPRFPQQDRQGTGNPPQPSAGHSSCSVTRQDTGIFGVEISKADTDVFKVPLL